MLGWDIALSYAIRNNFKKVCYRGWDRLKMSHLRGPLALLVTVTTASLTGIWYVHYRQTEDRARMYEGVKRDIERLERRKQQLAEEEARKDNIGT